MTHGRTLAQVGHQFGVYRFGLAVLQDLHERQRVDLEFGSADQHGINGFATRVFVRGGVEGLDLLNKGVALGLEFHAGRPLLRGWSVGAEGDLRLSVIDASGKNERAQRPANPGFEGPVHVQVILFRLVQRLGPSIKRDLRARCEPKFWQAFSGLTLPENGQSGPQWPALARLPLCPL